MEPKLLLLFCCTLALCLGRRGRGEKGRGREEGRDDKFHLFGPKCRGCCTVWPGPAIGKKCIFPFSWKGKTYNRCAYEPAKGDKYHWCSTKVDGSGNHVAGQRMWGKCNRECSQITPAPPKPTGPGPCECPKPGVEDGYMEYNEIKEKFAELWANNTALGAEVLENGMALTTKCPKDKCEEIQENSSRIEETLDQLKTENITTLEEKVATLISQVNKIESCFADKSSNNCPSAQAGKISITDAITALESPSVFNCMFTSGDVDTNAAVLSPYTCDVNDDNVVDATTGKFTVKKAGKYRLTFMALNFALNKKKVISSLVKTSSGAESKIARSVAQSMIGDEQEQITTTIDIIHALKVDDTIHVSIQVKSGSKITGQADTTKPQQVTFTGEFIRQ